MYRRTQIHHDLKRQLAREVVALMDGRDQSSAAALFGLRQPDVSLLRAGEVGRFSITRLLRLIASRGYHVELTLRPVAPPARIRQTPTVSVQRYDRFGQPCSESPK